MARAPCQSLALWREWGRFYRQQVLIESNRLSNGLCCVVNDYVKPRFCRLDPVSESVHARHITEIDPEDLQPVFPLLVVRFNTISGGSIVCKPSLHQHTRPAPQQPQCDLVSNLHSGTRYQGHPARHILRVVPFEPFSGVTQGGWQHVWMARVTLGEQNPWFRIVRAPHS